MIGMLRSAVPGRGLFAAIGPSTAACDAVALPRMFRAIQTGRAMGRQADPLPLKTGRPRLVVLGTGWAGARILRDIDPKKFDITVISPRNHMVFTPLLASSCVGTLETRSVTVAVQDIQPALKSPQNYYYTAQCTSVDERNRSLECLSPDGVRFFVDYDVLAICTGSQGSTFGIPGVTQHTHFLRDAANSTAIRAHLMHSWGLASVPGRSAAERARLLHVVIVGGGPTGVEFAGELGAFINHDLAKVDVARARDMRVTLIEPNEVLGSFDASLREYAVRKLERAGIRLIRGVAKEVREHEIVLNSGEVIPYGLCVWSTGVGPTRFTLGLPFEKTNRGRVAVDDHLRTLLEVPEPIPESASDATGADGGVADGAAPAAAPSGPVGPITPPRRLADVSIAASPALEQAGPLDSPRIHSVPNVFSLGDCSANPDAPLPALAQVAEQQGKYVAALLNASADAPGATVEERLEAAAAAQEPFKYRSLGAMASVGGTSAILQLDKPAKGEGKPGMIKVAGFTSWVAWRSAYLTRLGTWKNRIYVATNWTMTLLFGRDISQW